MKKKTLLLVLLIAGACGYLLKHYVNEMHQQSHTNNKKHTVETTVQTVQKDLKVIGNTIQKSVKNALGITHKANEPKHHCSKHMEKEEEREEVKSFSDARTFIKGNTPDKAQENLADAVQPDTGFSSFD